MGKLLILVAFVLSFHVPAFTFDSKASVKMGETVTIEEKMFRPLINAKVVSAKVVASPTNVYTHRPLVQFIAVNVEISNVGNRSDEVEFDDFSIFMSSSGLSERIGWPVQVITNIGGREVVHDRKYEPVLEPGAKVTITLIFGLTLTVQPADNLIFAFDEDGYPRSSLKVTA